VALADDPDVRVVIDAPSGLEYVVDALAAVRESVSVRLANRGTTAVEVGLLRVEFSATRNGVSFPCKKYVGAPVGSREPRVLAPGQSLRVERDLDCMMPLPGHYDVSVYIGLTAEPENRDASVGAFTLDVESKGPAPRPYPSRPGLYVAMVGDRAARPLSQEAWARGDYHVVLAVVNGSNRPVRVGSGRLAFLTYRKGSRLPCSGQAASLVLPAELAPGAMSTVREPLACAPSEEGQYEVIGRLTFGDPTEEVEVGRVSLKVTRYPITFDPDPNPLFRRPSGWLE
jgi:hypothetical protein